MDGSLNGLKKNDAALLYHVQTPNVVMRNLLENGRGVAVSRQKSGPQMSGEKEFHDAQYQHVECG
jgi:hypothetical protein